MIFFSSNRNAFTGDEWSETTTIAFHMRNLTRYQSPAANNISIPDGCIEPKDKAVGWPITTIGTCRDSYLFKFDEQLTRSKSDRNMTMKLGDYDLASATPSSSSSSSCNQVIMRCRVNDFHHPAHFVLNLIPCWSTWWEYVQQNNNTNIKLMLVGNDNYGGVSTFVKDWMEIFDCSAEINSKPYYGGEEQQQLEEKDGEVCASWEQRYVDVSFATEDGVHGVGIPEGNGFHFNTPKDLSPKAGMYSYFFNPDHAYAFRLHAYSKALVREGNHQLRSRSDYYDKKTQMNSTASPSFRVLFINRNNGKRVIGGDGVANIASSIRAKLSNLGIPSNAISVNETDDFGAWDGYGQLQMMRDHDIIISPHGNQLSSLGFAPECAAMLEIYPRYFAIPGYFLPWAVNAGIQSFGLHDGVDISTTETYLQNRGRVGHIRARDTPFLNKTNEIVMALPALVQVRRECCQTLLDNKEFNRVITSRCAQ